MKLGTGILFEESGKFKFRINLTIKLPFDMKNGGHFGFIVVQPFLLIKMIQKNIVEKVKTHIL